MICKGSHPVRRLNQDHERTVALAVSRPWCENAVRANDVAAECASKLNG